MGFEQEWETAKELVSHVLETHPATRSNDNLLVWQCWKELAQAKGHDDITEELIKDFNKVGYITRSRRQLQEQGKYLPPEQVDEKRQEREEDFHNHFSHDQERESGELVWS